MASAKLQGGEGGAITVQGVRFFLVVFGVISAGLVTFYSAKEALVERTLVNTERIRFLETHLKELAEDFRRHRIEPVDGVAHPKGAELALIRLRGELEELKRKVEKIDERER